MGSRNGALEQEVKLAGDARVLERLEGVPLEERVFLSTYHDTPDGRLAQFGMTLRRRSENGKSVWQLKIPRQKGRYELEAAGGPGEPPAAVTELLVALLHGADGLAPVARLRTRRKGVRISERGSTADAVLDTVTVLRANRGVDSFAELELELIDGDADGLELLEQRLREAGATDGDARPKLLRVLPEPEREREPEADGSPVGQLRAMLARQHAALLSHDPGFRLGDDPEDVHQLRVAARRTRAVLRAARPFLDTEWSEPIRAELSWFGGALGETRDLDVLVAYLRREAASLEPDEQLAFDAVLDRFEEERASAYERGLEAMSSERYLQLLDRLAEAARAPRVRTNEFDLAEIPAAEFRKLRKAMKALGREPTDDVLHRLRIRGKRARYATELAEGTLGKPGRRFLREAKAFQDALGEHQDAAVAEERLRHVRAPTRSRSAALAVGRLLERQRTRRAKARGALPRTWKRLERSGRRAFG